MATCKLLGTALALSLSHCIAQDRLVLEGKGKHIVFVSGDEEYRSEEALPALARILNKHHGFKCTVLFALNPATGQIDPDIKDNIPGLEVLEKADLLVLFTRFRNLPDGQMRHIVSYVERKAPVIALRTATHAFALNQGAFQHYSWNSRNWEGGFGKNILGETWIRHHGKHGVQSTRGQLREPRHPILRSVSNIWGPTDVYAIRLPLPPDAQVLVDGEVLQGMRADSPPASMPVMPIAWTRTAENRKVFVTTMGAATDLPNEGVRRMIVNACFWALGKNVPKRSRVDFVRPFEPTPFRFGGFVKGRRPGDL